MIGRFLGTLIAVVVLLIVAGAAIWLMLAVWGGILDSVRSL